MIFLAIFFMSLLRVYARAAQQLNVVDYQWFRVPFYSYLMSATDYFQWGAAGYLIAERNWVGAGIAAVIAGTGATIGSYIAMYLHRRGG